MSFEAYIANSTKIKNTRTAKKKAKNAGIYSYDMKAGDLVKFLKDKHDLGHGHCMGIWAYWKMKG